MGLFEIPNGERMPPELGRIFQSIMSMRRRSAYREQLQLRASSFPICPRAYHIFRRTPVERRPVFEESFVSDSTSSMGTALHLALQKWFGISGQLYGNWVCVHCRKIRRHSTGLQICRVCGREMIYKEYAVAPSEQIPFSGHIDGILELGGEFWLIDFKGSSAQAIKDVKESNKPQEKHYLQVNAYANAVNLNPEAYGNPKEIQKIIIIYVDRSTPHRLWYPIKVQVSQRIYSETVGRIRLAYQSLEDLTVPRGLCVNPTDSYARYCPWKVVCFSPALDGMLSDHLEPDDSGRPKHSEAELLVLAAHLEQAQ